MTVLVRLLSSHRQKLARNVFMVKLCNAAFLITSLSPLCSASSSRTRMSSASASPRAAYGESNTCEKSTCLDKDLSIHAAHITEIHDVPMRVLIRPIPSILDEEKVLSLMETIQDESTRNTVPPIDVLWITGREGGDYYYSFGGCHRYEAHKRLRKDTIPCKLFKSTVEDLKVYLGSSTPDLL